MTPEAIISLVFDEAIEFLRTMPEHNSLWRVLALRYARRVQPLMSGDADSALDLACRFAMADASHEDCGIPMQDVISAWQRVGVAGQGVFMRALGKREDKGPYLPWKIEDPVTACQISASWCIAAASAAGGVERVESEIYWLTDQLLLICEEPN